MRFVTLIPAVFSLFVSGSAFAQSWDVYTNRENFFSVNLPGDPAQTQAQYKTGRGTSLNARVFTAVAPPGSILSGKYSVTVVDYSNAKDEIPNALDDARKVVGARGKVTYDQLNNLDLHLTRRMTVETPNSRILGEFLMAANNRLYITEAETALNVPPPANFQASLQILDDSGVRIRTRTTLGVAEGVTSGLSAGGIPDEPDKVAATMKGTWRMAGGSCEAAYFKSGAMAKTKRGEAAMAGTVVNSGKTVSGQLILNGSREGQFIDPKTDEAVMLFAPDDGGKLSISALGGPAKGWPDVTLDLCPATRG
ncbi:MAG TPA: hypothetical protein VEU06_01800 [Micropepsaceae bacterium]|nr:hypothetical protein [Micropepsaceae bacterium]